MKWRGGRRRAGTDASLPLVAVVLAMFASSCEEAGQGVGVDLSVFSPSGVVTVDEDGREARIGESRLSSPSSLSYQTFSVPREADELRFAYRLEVAQGGEDYFDVFIGDISAPALSAGGSGGVYEGRGVIDLSVHQGDVIAVVFDLTSGFADGGRGSAVTISEVQVTSRPRDDG